MIDKLETKLQLDMRCKSRVVKDTGQVKRGLATPASPAAGGPAKRVLSTQPRAAAQRVKMRTLDDPFFEAVIATSEEDALQKALYDSKLENFARGSAKQLVTQTHLRSGALVARGPDWQHFYKQQDYFNGQPGTVTMSTCKSFHANMHFFLNMHAKTYMLKSVRMLTCAFFRTCMLGV